MKSLPALLLLFVYSVLACASPSQDVDCRHPYQGKLNFAIVSGLTERCHLRSVDELLALLPESFRKNFLLAYNSRSRHEATQRQPRIIFFEPDTKFILAVAGKKDGANSDVVEIIEWSDAQKRFIPRTVNFGTATTTSPVHGPDANPQTCFSCHRTDFRPNWDSYSQWPGFYGSDDGEIRFDSPEDKKFRDFLRAVEKEPGRYAYIVDLPHVKDLPQQAESKKGAVEEGSHEWSITGARYLPTNAANLGAKNHWGSTSHPFDFNFALLDLAFQRVVRKLKEQWVFDLVKYSLLGALAECPQYDSFFPPEWRDALQASTGQTYESIRRETLAGHRQYQIARGRRQLELAGELPYYGNSGSESHITRLPPELDSMSDAEVEKWIYEFSPDYNVANQNLRFAMALHGIDNDDWYLTREKNSHSFWYSPSWRYQFNEKLLEEVLRESPELAEFYHVEGRDIKSVDHLSAYFESNKKPRLCAILKSKSLSAHERFSPPPSPKKNHRDSSSPTH